MGPSHGYDRISGLGFDLAPEELEQLLASVASMGKAVLSQARGQMPLFRFSHQLSRAIGVQLPLGVADLSDSVKTLLQLLDDPQLKLMAPSDMPGVGIVFDQLDPDSWPVGVRRQGPPGSGAP